MPQVCPARYSLLSLLRSEVSQAGGITAKDEKNEGAKAVK